MSSITKVVTNHDLVCAANSVHDIIRLTVATTAGSGGRLVCIGTGFTPSYTKDGQKTLASLNSFECPVENSILKSIKEAADLGDGSTLCAIAAAHIISEGAAHKGKHIKGISEGIRMGLNHTLQYIDNIKRDVTDSESIRRVAEVASNWDTKLGSLIAEGVDKVGRDGVISVSESQSRETILEVSQGMKFDRGYISPYLITDAGKQRVELDNALVVIIDKKISSVQHILPCLEHAANHSKPLLIIAEDIEGEALATLIVNKMRGTFKVNAVKAPGFGDRRTENMNDIAALVGCQIISSNTGVEADKLDASNVSQYLGNCSKVISTKDHTTIIGGGGAKEGVDARVQQIRNEISNSTSTYDKEKLQERLAKLAGGIGLIKIGSETEAEMKEAKDRAEDAVNATKAAIEGGVVPGGGTTLMRCAHELSQLEIRSKLGVKTDAHIIGLGIFASALQEQFHHIADNAGFCAGRYFEQIISSDDTVLDVRSGEVGSAYDKGICDPANVIKNSLTKAVSCGISVISTGSYIVEKKSDDDNSGGGGAGMGGMHGGGF